MAITLDGTDGVTTTGLTSNGIDDNATSTAVTIDSSSNVGIGTSAPSTTLDVKSTSTTSDVIRATNNTGTDDLNLTQRGTSGWAIKSSLDLDLHADYDNNTSAAASNIRLFTDASERMRIDSSGNLLVGCTTSASSTIAGVTIRNPNIGASRWSSGAVTTEVTHIQFMNANGVVGTIKTNGSSTAYNTSSDHRLKENVVTLDNATDRIKQIPVHRFNFIADPNTTVDGFLAHEVQDVVPEAITGTKDEVDDEGNPVYQGIDQSKLVPLLTAALQEAVATIEELKARVAALEAN